jgi:hypothetical protein
MRIPKVTLREVVTCGNRRWLVDRKEKGKRKRSFFKSRAEAEAEADRIRSLFEICAKAKAKAEAKAEADRKAAKAEAKAEADVNLIRALFRSRGEAEADRIRAGWPAQTIPVDLDRPMTVQEFASWIGVAPVWVRRRLSALPGVIRHTQKVVRIIPRFYAQLAEGQQVTKKATP